MKRWMKVSMLLLAVAIMAVLPACKSAETGTPDQSGKVAVKSMALTVSPMIGDIGGDGNPVSSAECIYGSKVVTATISPSNATNKTVQWTIAWENPTDPWAVGKDVTDYVEVNGIGLKAAIGCKAPFGEEVCVKVVSRDNASAYATITVEFEKDFTLNTLKITDSTTGEETLASGSWTAAIDELSHDLNLDRSPQFSMDVDYSAYTKDVVYEFGVTISLTGTMKSVMQARGYTPKTVGLVLSASGSSFFNVTDVAQNLFNVSSFNAVSFTESELTQLASNSHFVLEFTATNEDGDDLGNTFTIEGRFDMDMFSVAVTGITTDVTEIVF